MMFLDELPTELLVHIFLSLSTVDEASKLASTCQRLYTVLKGRKIEVLSHIAESQFGPLDDAVQLVTQNSSQPAHQHRAAPWSIALLKQIVDIGWIAQAWARLYPLKKWKGNFENRRLLSKAEEYAFRRALYRFWLYSRAFHNAEYPRTTRLNPIVVQERALLLHNWTTLELAEIADVCEVIREVVQHNICPSNGTIQKKFRKRFPDLNHQLLFNMPFHSKYYSKVRSVQNSDYYTHSQTPYESKLLRYKPTAVHEPGCEGWGDDVSHYYVVEDMMKLDPEQILWLKANASSKTDVEDYVLRLGPWFENNGETFSQTLEFVVAERVVDLAQFMDAIKLGEAGVARPSWRVDVNF